MTSFDVFHLLFHFAYNAAVVMVGVFAGLYVWARIESRRPE